MCPCMVGLEIEEAQSSVILATQHEYDWVIVRVYDDFFYPRCKAGPAVPGLHLRREGLGGYVVQWLRHIRKGPAAMLRAWKDFPHNILPEPINTIIRVCAPKRQRRCHKK